MAIAMLSIRPAWAGPKEPVTGDEAAVKRKARELLQDGYRLVNRGDFAAALPKFNAAYELYPSPNLLLNIGTSLLHTGRYAAAATAYERYLADPAADPAREGELRRVLSEIDDLVGWIQIRHSEPGVRVRLDGRLLDEPGRQRKVRADPGPHSVVAEKPGRDPAVHHVSVKARQTAEVNLVMTDVGEPAQPVPVRAIVGYGAAGLGVAALVVGGIIGGMSVSTSADAEAECPDDGDFAGYCTERGVDLVAQARSEGTASVITLAAGGLAVVVGLAVAWTGSDDEEPATTGLISIGPGPMLQGVVHW